MVLYEILVILVVVYLTTLLSQTIRYYVKFALFGIGSILSASILPIPSLFKFPIRDPRIGLLPAAGVMLVMKLLGFTYDVRGIENIDRERGGVIVVNHQSGIDLASCHMHPVALIGRGTVVVKKLVLYVFPFGPACWLWGTLFIDRKNLNQTKMQMDKECDAIKCRSNKIIIFPEGSRSQEDIFLPFKKGPFHLAIQSQSMIQPVVVSKYHFINHKRKYFEKGLTIVSILPEISCEGLTKEDLPALLEKTRNLMQTHFNEISKETRDLNRHLGPT